MNAIVSCKEHDHSKRDIYDICETNEGGEVSIKALVNPTSLIIFDHRPRYKCIVKRTNRLLLVKPTHSCAKLDV